LTQLGALLREHPDLAFFLALALGYLVGRVRFGSFLVGSLTGVLLVAVALGQFSVTIADNVKQVFFLLFLFAIGFRTGPAFFRGLRADGLAQAGLAAVLCVVALLTAILVGRVMGLDPGTAAGLLAGALTESATLGTAGNAVAGLSADPALRAQWAANIPVAFAVSYLVGTVIVTWFLAQIGPRLMRVDLAAECAALERAMAGAVEELDDQSAWRAYDMRAFQVGKGTIADGRLVREVEILPVPRRVFVVRLRRGGDLLDTTPETRLQAEDVVAVHAPRDFMVGQIMPAAREVGDRALLDIPLESVDVYLTARRFAGMRVQALRRDPAMRGAFIDRISRSGQEMPLLAETVVEQGDVITLTGVRHLVTDATRALGSVDKLRDETDLVAVATAIVLGGLVGLPALHLAGIELGLSKSVGVLLGGLVLGWLRSVRPIFARVPEPALWVFESLGLTGFIAVIGFQAGPNFIHGLRGSGISMVFITVVMAIVPHAVGVLAGRHVFRLHPGIVLGVCAGAGTATPALAAVQEVAKSRVPTLGYGVSYAVGNVLLALWGSVIVIAMR